MSQLCTIKCHKNPTKLAIIQATTNGQIQQWGKQLQWQAGRRDGLRLIATADLWTDKQPQPQIRWLRIKVTYSLQSREPKFWPDSAEMLRSVSACMRTSYKDVLLDRTENSCFEPSAIQLNTSTNQLNSNLSHIRLSTNT